MAREEDNIESCVDESSSSTLFEDVPCRVEVNGVIMWLKPVRETRVDSFWRRFSFPPNVQVSFRSSGPHFLDRMDEDRGGMNFIY